MITGRLVTIILIVLAVCSPVRGDGFRFDSIPDNTRESTLTLGYGNSFNIQDDDDHFQYGQIRYRFGKFTSPRNETAYEVSGAYNFEGKQLFTLAATIGYRHYFLMRGQTALSYDFGIGGMHMTRHLSQQATKTNFTEYAGVTFQYALTQSSAFTLGYRYSHSSNAGLEKPNGGLNVNEFVMGYMWLY